MGLGGGLGLRVWGQGLTIYSWQMETDDGVLFLDMKCGNLMQQRISRIQTDQAVEIARLIKQYIIIGESW